jgi:hypothetical protein
VAQASSGFSDKVMTSPDGINWTVGTCPDQEWISICWSSEMSVYVAGATSGTGNRVMTSADGITWKTAVTPLDNAWRDFIWVSDLSLFVAVGQSSFYDQVLTSADGGATFTTLTFATDKGLSQFPKGVAITQDNNAASGFAGMTDSFAKTMVVSGSTGTWSANTGNYVKGPSTPIKTKLYCKLNAGLTVTDLQSPDPGYTAAAGTGPFTVTFPATLPSGNPPDTDLPAGTELTVEVQASNHAGTSTKHQTITPA